MLYRVGMRRTPRLLIAVVASALLLVGCVPDAPAPTERPTVAAPVYGSDEEALAAATEAYAAYIEASDAVIRDGGTNPERVQPFLSAELYEIELDGFERLLENELHGTGATTLSTQLQQFDSAAVVIYVCEDLSGTDLVDSTGASILTDGPPSNRAFEVELDVADSLRITRIAEWDGGGVC